MKFLTLLIVLFISLVSSGFAKEDFSFTTRRHPGSREHIRGTFSGHWTWAAPSLIVRLDEGTLESLVVNAVSGKSVEIRAILCEPLKQYPYYQRVTNSSEEIVLKDDFKEGTKLSLPKKRFTISLRNIRSRKDLAGYFIGFQVVTQEMNGGNIYFLHAPTFLISNDAVQMPTATASAE